MIKITKNQMILSAIILLLGSLLISSISSGTVKVKETHYNNYPDYLVDVEQELDLLQGEILFQLHAYYNTTIPFNVSHAIPMIYGDQAPVLIHIMDDTTANILNYQIINDTNYPNKKINFTIAPMQKDQNVTVHFEFWVLVKNNDYHDLPNYMKIPEYNELPENTTTWLKSTSAVQSDNMLIQNKAHELKRFTANNLIKLADKIAFFSSKHRSLVEPIFYNLAMWAWKYENKIPQKIFNLMPKNYQDALSTYLFGGVCTGRANLGTALFRANGIPAKDLAVMPTWLDFKYDMHFISQYYCPGYGWVFVETSYGIQKTPCEPKYNIVMRVNYPDDENKAGNYSTGISGNGGVEQFRWIDKTFVYFSHLSSVNSAQIEKELTTSQNLADTAFQLTQNVYEMYTKYFGVNLIGENQQHVVNATLAQKNAITCFNQSDIQGYIDDMTIAYIEYMEIA